MSARVGVVMGSDSDLPVMQSAIDALEELGVDHEVHVVSAHRTPHEMIAYGTDAASRGLSVIIAGAGGAAHLPGMLAAVTTLPVIGVPVKTTALNGMDSLLSIVQMPRGVPVATVAIDGGRNAGLLAAQILASIGVPVPPAPRKDLLPLVQYMPPICPGCGPNDAGPVADLLRLNTGIPPTPVGKQKRLGFLVGDVAGFPNGRRPIDDVVDIASRAVAGILVDPVKYGAPIGDGVNINENGYGTTFPYVMPANSGRNSHHVGPGQDGCSGQPNGICPVN